MCLSPAFVFLKQEAPVVWLDIRHLWPARRLQGAATVVTLLAQRSAWTVGFNSLYQHLNPHPPKLAEQSIPVPDAPALMCRHTNCIGHNGCFALYAGLMGISPWPKTALSLSLCCPRGCHPLPLGDHLRS